MPGVNLQGKFKREAMIFFRSSDRAGQALTSRANMGSERFCESPCESGLASGWDSKLESVVRTLYRAPSSIFCVKRRLSRFLCKMAERAVNNRNYLKNQELTNANKAGTKNTTSSFSSLEHIKVLCT